MNRSIVLRSVLCALAVATWGLDQSFADHIHTSGTVPDKARGEKLYNTTCIACHGDNGQSLIPGVPSLRGRDNRLVRKDLETLLHNVDKGYQSPGSTLAMPPKGGNASLSEQDLVDILGYMRQEFAAEVD